MSLLIILFQDKVPSKKELEPSFPDKENSVMYIAENVLLINEQIFASAFQKKLKKIKEPYFIFAPPTNGFASNSDAEELKEWIQNALNDNILPLQV